MKGCKIKITLKSGKSVKQHINDSVETFENEVINKDLKYLSFHNSKRILIIPVEQITSFKVKGKQR